MLGSAPGRRAGELPNGWQGWSLSPLSTHKQLPAGPALGCTGRLQPSCHQAVLGSPGEGCSLLEGWQALANRSAELVHLIKKNLP